MNFNREVELRLARNFRKLLKLRAEVNNIGDLLHKTVDSLNETNAILQSLPLYSAGKRLDAIAEARKEKPSLTLIVTE